MIRPRIKITFTCILSKLYYQHECHSHIVITHCLTFHSRREVIPLALALTKVQYVLVVLLHNYLILPWVMCPLSQAIFILYVCFTYISRRYSVDIAPLLWFKIIFIFFVKLFHLLSGASLKISFLFPRHLTATLGLPF